MLCGNNSVNFIVIAWFYITVTIFAKYVGIDLFFLIHYPVPLEITDVQLKGGNAYKRFDTNILTIPLIYEFEFSENVILG